MRKPFEDVVGENFIQYLPLMLLSIIPIALLAMLLPLLVFLPFLPFFILLIPFAPLMIVFMPFMPKAQLMELAATTAKLEAATLNIMGLSLGLIALMVVCAIVLPILSGLLKDKKQLKAPSSETDEPKNDLSNNLVPIKGLTPLLNHQRDNSAVFASVATITPLVEKKSLKH